MYGGILVVEGISELIWQSVVDIKYLYMGIRGLIAVIAVYGFYQASELQGFSRLFLYGRYYFGAIGVFKWYTSWIFWYWALNLDFDGENKVWRVVGFTILNHECQDYSCRCDSD